MPEPPASPPSPAASAPRIRRGPPAPSPEVRASRQRGRLFAAAARVFARSGYADASAGAIAREAGMSKATFYEHFANKEDCLAAMFDVATQELLAAMRETGEDTADEDARTRARAMVEPFLMTLADFPDEAQTLLVGALGAGPRVLERRDRALKEIASYLDELTRADHARGAGPRFASPHDAHALVGAVIELAARQIRTGTPRDVLELAPVVERLALGLLATGEHP